MFKRIIITVPAAGINTLVKETGCGIIVESMKSYSNAEDVPLLIFNNVNQNPQPLYPYSKYSMPNFTRFYIRGTSQSVGDTIYLLNTNQPTIQSISPVFNLSVLSENGVTQEIASTNVAQYLPNSILYSTGAITGKKAKSVLVQCKTNAITYSIEADPIQGGLGHLLTTTGFLACVKIEGFSFIENFKFISTVLNTHGVLTVTPEY